ncbi:S-adenosyl-L-homocysteine hydrolase, NAD binding-like domain protein [Bacteriovorax sp. BAL6_X]|uniref:NAD(P)-dependent oxidoreductase n=1 Tax=Bacteriovorax sp. BAL6_X TaxID=1201290 RepID=UPI000386AE5D|nr:hydroxyacid dehydrogenase [Bacteriovorax sp. BAL6_X]EPZ50092.1 S-adenosyl-L-homocysteine hydrolase, NAD binding-like domain protein [Bacteriovorax sp. BAL6_X]
MKPFIVVCDGMDAEVFASLQAINELEVHPKAKLTQDEIKELLPKANALVIRSSTTIGEEYLELAPNLKYVIRAGAGTDNIDKVKCGERGVKVSNTPGANNNSAAEHAIALMMTVLRHTAAADATMKNGGWDKSKYTGNELANKKIGIVGFGQIGKIVAKRLQGFDPQVKFFDPFCESSELDYVSKANTVEEIFETCDIITLHTPLMDATKGMVNKDLFNKMQPHAILVNASRGGIVNEEDLAVALKDKKFKAAGFDVFATEPLEEDSPLRKISNLVLTPHLGASTDEAQLRVGEMAVNQLKEFFLNDNLLHEVKA